MLGAGFGLAVYGLTVLADVAIAGPIHFASVATANSSAVFLAAATFLALSFMEELGFRGYPLCSLATAVGAWKAQLIVAVAFAASHLAFGWSWQAVVFGVLPSAFLFGAAALTFGDLMVPIGLHAPTVRTNAAFDVMGAEGFDIASASVTATGTTRLGVGYVTDPPTCGVNTLYDPSVVGGTSTFYGMPSSVQRTNDLHALSASTAAGQTVTRLFHSIAGQTLTVGQALSASAVTNGNGVAHKQLNASAGLGADYQMLVLSYTDATNTLFITGTTTYSGSATVALVAPNLAAAPGFLASYAPALSSTVNWSLMAASYSVFTSTPTSRCIDGGTVKQAQVNGTM